MSEVTPIQPEEVAKEPSTGSHLVRRLLHNPVAVVTSATLLIIILGAVFASYLAPYDPNNSDLQAILQGPSSEHYLGTDGAGRDVFSRLLFATRYSLAGALLAMGLAAIIGVTSGLIAGYFGKWFESFSTWVVSLVMALPGIIVLLAARSVIGPSLWYTMAIFGLLLSTGFHRLTHAAVMGVRNELYVDAARVSGVRNRSIISRHILSVVRAPVIIQMTIMLIVAIALQAGLGFLGLMDNSIPTWGGMLGDAFAKLYQDPQGILWPALTIGITAMALALFGNALRDEVERSATPKKAATGTKAAEIVLSDVPTVIHQPADADREDLLRIDGLVVGYDQPDGSLKQVVSGVDISVKKGEIHGLIGESGSGKTQTAFSVLRLLPHGGRIAAGTVHFDGQNLATLSESEMRKVRGARISYIPQEPMSNLDPSFTIGSQLVEPMRKAMGMSKAAAKARALELLDRVGIPDPKRTFKSYPHQVSGGMAQRVLIAGAISCEADLIIADEPTTALDVTVQADILDLLRSLQRELNVGILLVTHNFGVVADICDWVSVMQDGRIVETGPVGALFANPRDEYTKSLFSAILDEEHARGAYVAPAGTAAGGK
ncbi:dipeptide/oligopeptide/nickel ABC transporter permease/ATP-binding protein [Demequina aurantiaca]|uniref:dipeptide/oligopeptide/nickel ABC transporter permease/ATP-binding protein n=1 Tax=Demequina aurantiaca TaxID=676200 RepID=UPI000785D3A1|nr:dipeptide/oligopeptide/nickel ABC transporter permease/ATP-binding protein [Demequina aurantiaca]